MGLISLVLDCLILSSACAGARRLIGVDVGSRVLSHITHPTGNKAAKGFFNAGEWIVDKGYNAARNRIINHKLNDSKPPSETNSTPSDPNKPFYH
ncbi:hypothetical protein CYY_006668 [Polysphondylium violaceum]|uniref:Uncharacterized protein n=1 Tax=Polysphondylium violaceum TaxID=133409 RepID=A0A8J4PS56_9MYCE|nr:hypothetical protein CYY_006668 [Polysphondylium violaceum]